MKISAIRIEQLRQFRRPLVIEDLQPGINLFTGPNEAGKSTIVAAIRAVFLERHRSNSVEDLRPWGESAASPTIHLSFSHDATAYQLSKSFLHKKRCELTVGNARFDGADAEDRLAQLLGFEHASKGISKAEHWGIPGLLWIEQGTAHAIEHCVEHAATHLRTALNESLGEVTSTGGDALLARIEEARNELLTASASKPRGQYAAAIEQVASLANKLSECDAEIAAYRHKVDTLTALQGEHTEDEANKPWLTFRAQQNAAAEKLAEIERLENALVAQRERAAQMDTQIQLLREQADNFAAQEQAHQTRAAAQTHAHQAHVTAMAQIAPWQARREEAQARHDRARQTLRLARQEDTRQQLTQQLKDLRARGSAATESLQRAQAQQNALLHLRTQAAASELNAADLSSLREQHAQIRELQIRQQASATRLHYALEHSRSMQVGDAAVSGSGERLLTAPTAIVLPGFGTLTIAPGGADLNDLKLHEAELADQHTALLQKLGLATLAEAEARRSTHAQFQADIHTAAAALKMLAPLGIEALHTDIQSQSARASELEQNLLKLPPAHGHSVPSIADAERAEEAAGASLKQVQDALHAAELAANQARAALDAAQREAHAAQALLLAPERPARVAKTNADLVDARAELATLLARIEGLTKQVEAALPHILKQDVERYRRSADQLEAQFNQRRNTLMRLEVELQAAGAQGLEERRAELARDHAQAQRRLEELTRRATALDYLLSLLREKRQALTRKLQAPLQKHLNRYLQLVFPQANLEIDENLSPGPLTRSGHNGAETSQFEALSFGAREQMGIISRLAYADLLQEAGRPTLIILDDALVHSDEVRLAQMKRVLFDAATRHQILLFTCHPTRWRDIGVAARSLESLKVNG